MARVKLTAGRIRDFVLPADAQQAFLWDIDARQLAVRATAKVKAYIFQARLSDGTEIRITIGDVRDWSIDQAREEARRLQTIIDLGQDPREIKAEQAAEESAASKKAETTLAAAIKDYVANKRRAKDGLALKERTVADYCGMVAEPRQLENGTMTVAGALFPLAKKSIYSISAEDIREAHAAVMKRSERQAAYAMQVLRAVFNWHGVKVPDNPLSKDVAGKKRIVIPQAKATGNPIPPERIGAWWRAVEQAANPESRDYLKFLILTGCRVSEPLSILVEDCDLMAGRVVLRDTKNRKDHTILLSRQAAEIVERNITDKKPTATLFELDNCKKTIATIERRCGAAFRLKDLRPTFASIAEELVSAYTLKVMVNHANTGDVTGTNYVRKGETALRAGWQAVADLIESKAAESNPPANVTDLSAYRDNLASATAQ
jgi:integrase